MSGRINKVPENESLADALKVAGIHLHWHCGAFFE